MSNRTEHQNPGPLPATIVAEAPAAVKAAHSAYTDALARQRQLAREAREAKEAIEAAKDADSEALKAALRDGKTEPGKSAEAKATAHADDAARRAKAANELENEARDELRTAIDDNWDTLLALQHRRYEAAVEKAEESAEAAAQDILEAERERSVYSRLDRFPDAQRTTADPARGRRLPRGLDRNPTHISMPITHALDDAIEQLKAKSERRGKVELVEPEGRATSRPRDQESGSGMRMESKFIAAERPGLHRRRRSSALKAALGIADTFESPPIPGEVRCDDVFGVAERKRRTVEQAKAAESARLAREHKLRAQGIDPNPRRTP